MPNARSLGQKRAEARGSSKTLIKTIREIEALLKGEDIHPSAELRQLMHDKLRLLVEAKFKEGCEYGFAAAHAVCRDHSKAVPKKIKRFVAPTVLGTSDLLGENDVPISLVSEVK
ncbi:hypothetical protein [Urbifossiella limnaea]|uniref:Uncharacterized protein n=1 Tax=Urbifossiella limnaea TaxID=2528023 RepID=A0A517XY98_9BACT|nr:hypothetical protein [Urbifossiella limnaea]QDU22510.1 hypothetical protein ETAA1_44920 [Urbifossiella limnaea]